MKKITLAVWLLTLSVVAQNRNTFLLDPDGLPASSRISIDRQLLKPLPLTAATFGEVRALTELNSDISDSYPWLSADGLRIYYTHGDNTMTELNFAQRSDTDSFFGPTTTIPLGFYINSAWLSENELECWFSGSPANAGLYYVQRNDINAPFSAPVEISLTGINVNFVTGPSLNATHNKLWIRDDGSILEFERTSDTEFAYSGTLHFPGVAGPGKLSNDNLDYFFSIKPIGATHTAVYQMSRATVLQPFDPQSTEMVQGIDDPNILIVNQPCTSANLEWIAYVKCDDNTFNGNNLFLARNQNLATIPFRSDKTITIYPNPSSAVFEFETNIDLSNAIIEVFNNTGAVLFRQPMTKRLDLSGSAKGIYFAKISNDGFSTVEKIILK